MLNAPFAHPDEVLLVGWLNRVYPPYPHGNLPTLITEELG